MFSMRLTFDCSMTDNATIRDGIAKIIDAINKAVGLSKMFSPVIKLSAFPGVYSSK